MYSLCNPRAEALFPRLGAPDFSFHENTEYPPEIRRVLVKRGAFSRWETQKRVEKQVSAVRRREMSTDTWFLLEFRSPLRAIVHRPELGMVSQYCSARNLRKVTLTNS